ncbi:MAG: hypothetical protein IPJ84_01770 [Bdellovibrionales bacterium]|nr:hypothetical protein [Bdellovibrionales bacterium]
MSSITYGAVLLLLVFITPALPLWALFRISIPKGRAILSTEWSIAIFGCLLSWFINGHHIAAYTHALLTSLAAGGTDIGAHGAAVMLMIGDHSAKDPETLLQTVSSWLFNWRSADLSFSNLVFTLHLRSFTFGLAGLLCLKGLFRFEKNAQLIPYKEGFPEKFSLWDKARILLCGISPIKIVGQGKYESKVIRHPLARFFQS